MRGTLRGWAERWLGPAPIEPERAEPSAGPDADASAVAWRRHAGVMVWTAVVATAILVSAIVFLNPYGNLPVSPFGRHAVMDTNQRYQYPALIRERNYDSVVLGTSTSRLLDPVLLDRMLGGRFANFSIDDGRAWEQMRLGKLVLRNVPVPRTIIIGLDTVWCNANADEQRITKRGFPEWIYDEDPWNDWGYMLNGRAFEIAGRRLFHELGVTPARIPSNGFEVFVPPEEEYDAAKARQYIWGQRDPDSILKGNRPEYVPTEAERAAWRYPALDYMAELLAAIPAETKVILAFMPVHVAAQPPPGSQQAASEAECKARLTRLAEDRKAMVVDFRIGSELTRNDLNYWDPLHYRLPVGAVIIDGIAAAVAGEPRAPDGTWVRLDRGRSLAGIGGG